MNEIQFIKYCVDNGIPKTNAIIYCRALQQDFYTEEDFRALKNAEKE